MNCTTRLRDTEPPFDLDVSSRVVRRSVAQHVVMKLLRIGGAFDASDAQGAAQSSCGKLIPTAPVVFESLALSMLLPRY